MEGSQDQQQDTETDIITEPEYTNADIKQSCENNVKLTENKEKAVIVILVRNNELVPMRRTLRQFEE
jgi:hypothetical protein